MYFVLYMYAVSVYVAVHKVPQGFNVAFDIDSLGDGVLPAVFHSS